MFRKLFILSFIATGHEYDMVWCLLWFEDLKNATKKLHFIDPTYRHSCLVPSPGVIWSLQQEVLLYAHLLGALSPDAYLHLVRKKGN